MVLVAQLCISVFWTAVLIRGSFIHTATVYRYLCGHRVVMPTYIPWLSSEPVIYLPVVMYTLPTIQKMEITCITRHITQGFQSCMQSEYHETESATRLWQKNISAKWLLKYCVQASFFRLQYASQAPS